MSSFEDLELQKLNNLVDTFTPAESAKYGEEVRYIKYLLSLLKKQKSQKQTKQTKQEEKKTEKKVRDSLANLLKTYSIKKPTDKTMDSLPENVMEDAKLAKVSTLYYKDKDAGQQYLEQAELAANKNGLVVVGELENIVVNDEYRERTATEPQVRFFNPFKHSSDWEGF